MRRLLGLLLVTGVFAGCSSPSSDEALGSLREGVGDVRERVTELQTRVEDLQTRSAETVAVRGELGEQLVLAAIGEFLPSDQRCDQQLLAADSPQRGWVDTGEWGWTDRHEWGWPAGIHGYEELIVQISCDITSEEFWFKHELRIQYPLKTGVAAESINTQVRTEVAAGITNYFTRARERFPDRIGQTEEELAADRRQHGGFHRTGNLDITGVVPYANDKLHSVFLPFYQNHPWANTTASPVVTMNFDLETGQQFSLPDVFKSGSDWVAKLTEIILRREGEMVTYPEMSAYVTPEFLASMDFTMGPDTLTLHAQPYSIWFPDWCCGSSPKHLEISYEELAYYLDSDGPYRHIEGFP